MPSPSPAQAFLLKQAAQRERQPQSSDQGLESSQFPPLGRVDAPLFAPSAQSGPGNKAKDKNTQRKVRKKIQHGY